MAKKQTTNPGKASQAVKTVAAVVPTLSPEEVVPPLIETPPEVLGFFPPAATLPESDTGSLPVVMNAGGQTFAEGDIAPESVVDLAPSPAPEVPPAESPSLPVSSSPSLDSTHPAIALAQRHSTGAGVPREGAPRYFTAPPPDILKRK